MNILFVSNLSGNLFAGPNNSVPAQVRAQAECDNVFWYNLNEVKRPEWTMCKNLTNYPSGRLADLPAPFNNPDIAIVEELYCFPFSKFVTDLQKAGVPYVIIPRSAMTAQGQKKRRLKKIVGNILFFNKMIKKAAAIQYLTKEEQKESAEQWKKESFIIPNGVPKQDNVINNFDREGIRAVYIGRFEAYQKGLDLLLESLAAEQEALRGAGFVINMYGPDQEDTLTTLKNQAKDTGIEDLIVFNSSVFGEDKRKVLLDSDVFVMTSRFEGHPMGMIEALSYGLPCIATVGTNLSEEISEYDAGWSATNDTESIKGALRAMLADKDSFKSKSENAIKLSEIYSWSEIASKSHKIYSNIAEEKKK